jgi:hypothetical protein
MKINIIDFLMLLMDSAIRWIALCIVTFLTVSVAVYIWTISNPTNGGFMGDESGYGAAEFIVVLFVIYASIPLSVLAIYQRYRSIRGLNSLTIMPSLIGAIAFLVLQMKFLPV